MPSRGLTSVTPAASLRGIEPKIPIAASPLTPLPRAMRMSTVSAWSSSVCAVSTWRAPALRAASAADTLLFSLDPLLHADRGARIFAGDLGERSAGGFFLAERRKRLAEAEQRVRRLGGGLVFGRDVEEGFRRIAEALALEQAL